MSTEGIEINGRNLMVKWADKIMDRFKSSKEHVVEEKFGSSKELVAKAKKWG